MLQSYILLAATAFLTISRSFGYSQNCDGSSRPVLHEPPSGKLTPEPNPSRRQWLVQLAIVTAATPIIGDSVAFAEETDSPPSYSIQKCSRESKAPCASTANVRNLDQYLPPWTFDRSPEEVMSRLKGAVGADSNCQILQQDGSQYLKVAANRNDLFSTVDELEFVINKSENVVFFRSEASNDKTDFGVIKKRLEEIRKRAGIFGVMGESMMTADSVTVDERGNGPLGQLKAFYGLQSGSGFEDVVLE